MTRPQYSPWSDLASRPHLFLVRRELDESVGGGAYVPTGNGSAAILLDEGLSQVERRCILTHELIHDERGTQCHAGLPKAWDAVIAREEVRVHDEAVRRLIPPTDLLAYCDGISDFFAVEPHEVAEAFHVTEEYAERALFLLAAERA